MNRRRVFRAYAPFIALLTLTACATPSRFEWGNYENALYAYAKRPDTRPQYRAALEKAIDQGRRTDRLAPGLLAELGYLSLEEDDTSAALSLFQEEMRVFPESRPFLQDVIGRINGRSSEGEAVS
ncbi:MAG: DUF4810 domain-containing protein [Phenylobacterium sp.]|uniref:DUF4810 domain-containing protein n=1 Tax=Phenylobacterium sp. TaxID=1871053 RepID=UPI00391B036A